MGQLYACLEGYREAWQDSYVGEIKNNHPVYLFQRLVVMVASLVAFGITEAILLGVAGMLSFSFWHNGVYYTYRDMLTPGYAPKRWKDHRDGSALMDIPYTTRLIMFILGQAIIIATIYINYLKHGVCE